VEYAVSDTSFITGQTFFSGATSTFGDKRGFKFTNRTGVDIVVTQLGRWVVSGNSQTHTLYIYDAAGTTVLGSVSVNTSGQPVGYLYATLSSPVTISAGQVVYFVSTETIGGDNYYNNGAQSVTITNIGAIESANVDGSGSHDGHDSGRMFGPVNFKYSSPVADYTSTGAGTWTSAGDQYSLNSLNLVTSAGDVVTVTAGTYTWGSGGVGVSISKAITFNATGVTVNIASDAQQYSSGGALLISAAASVSGITFNQSGSSNSTAINVGTASGWRIHDCTYNDNYPGSGAWSEGYFVYATTYGLVDNCTLTTGYGQAEPFFTRGPTDSWTTANSLGTANAFYIEDCTWNGAGYTDFNANARAAIRFNTFNETAKKIDSHGYSTNQSPSVGVRQVEGYNNTFTGTSGGYLGVEIRGGLPILWGNTSANSSAGFELVDYGYLTSNTNWTVYQTPLNYPLYYQVGTGQMTTINATALVAYQRCQIATVGTPTPTDYTAIGAANNNVGTVFTATGAGTGNGTVLIVPATEPGYVWNNTRSGSVWPVINGTPAAGAISLYRTQTGNPSATFPGADIIQSNRDYYADAGAAANTGVYVGTADTMAGTTAVGKNKQGFWVTDAGSWNVKFTGTIAVTAAANNYWCEVVSMGTTTVPQWQAIGAPASVGVGTQFKATGAGVGSGTIKPAQGRLYVSNNTSWVLSYTPYTYPHPLRGGAPTLSSATVSSAGTSISLVFSESCTTGAGGSGGVTVSPSGGSSTATYSSGSGSTTYVYTLSRTIQSGESLTVSYTQPGNGIEATSGGADVATFIAQAVTNNSTVSITQAAGLRNLAGLGGGF